VYIVGEVGICEELDLKGIQHLGGPQDADKRIELSPGFALEHDESVSACSMVFPATQLAWCCYMDSRTGKYCLLPLQNAPWHWQRSASRICDSAYPRSADWLTPSSADEH
jgi:hypothetical protein